MAEKKILAIMGATGAQGGGLADAVLSDPDSPFAVRAITRDRTSDAARALADRGAEVVEADLADPASIRSAFEGAHGVFAVTFFWAHFSPEQELADVRTMAEAAKAADIRHVIWSTLEDMRQWVPVEDDRMPTLGGRYKVPHFDAKGEADAIWAELGVPTTYLATSFYWENLIYFGMEPKRGEDGVLALNLPMGDKRLPGIAAADIGQVAYAIFRKGDEAIGERYGIAGDHPTVQEMADALSEALGEPVRYNAIPFDVYRGFGFPGADDLGNMFQVKHDFEEEFVAARPLDVVRELYPELTDFRTWARRNADRIPIEQNA